MCHKKGKVERFDPGVGLGEVSSHEGELYPFHCTQIADGSRDVAVGAEVEFVVVPGHRGTWEARWVLKAGAGGASG
ncbi:MAG: cold-shock protein [Acidimicrobiales bacterium]